jgi:protein NrfD
MPEKRTIDTVIRADVAFLAVELVLIALLLLSLASSTLSHIEAVKLLFSGTYGLVFWIGVIAIGIVAPIVLQTLELSHRIPHTVVPALLVLAGGFALRWVMVNAGQASEVVSAAARL